MTAAAARLGTARSPLTGTGRAVRVVVLGGASLLLATGAHTAAGGAMPSGWVLAVAGFVLGLLALLATTRRVRFPLLLTGLAGQQLVLHAVLGAAGAAALCTATGLHHALGQVSCRHLMAGAGDGWAMLAAHVLATLATAWVLARGEAWWWRAAERVALAAGSHPSRRGDSRRPRPVTASVARHVVVHADGPAAPRGPPHVLA